MRLFGLIGYPLTHSFSKKYFSEKFLAEGIKDCRYELFSISSIDKLSEILANPYLSGLNVTIPYKEGVLSYLDEADDVVSKIKACNCIRIRSGNLKGFNTDVIGFKKSFLPLLQKHHKKALVLGTGGAAKAIEWVLTEMGIEVKYVSRKPKHGQISYVELTDRVMNDYTVIINTTPLGMYPNVHDTPPIPYHAITADHYLFDAVYNPAKSLFLQKGEEKGALIKNGYEMLEIQAEESWNIWNE